MSLCKVICRGFLYIVYKPKSCFFFAVTPPMIVPEPPNCRKYICQGCCLTLWEEKNIIYLLQTLGLEEEDCCQQPSEDFLKELKLDLCRIICG